MKSIIITMMSFLLVTMAGTTASAQDDNSSGGFGNTLNLGFGGGYYGYVGHGMPVLHANYEIGISKNFTLAPFITYYSYSNRHYWGNNNKPYKHYKYRVTAIPIGVKGSYYFDDLLSASSKWDFYAAGSLGFAYRSIVWEDGYDGDYHVERGTSGLYLDIHIGTELHLNSKFGLFLDLSNGISTFGLAIH